ncbi:TRIC cation channel family protein [Flocculibacter collagenilyticus]|uniref:TRIC cation channel family protein n=1 Tax=Flocculibacter collagenilyticus TaxID=2744479 RepID=UPI0018F4F959|nr:TRIC cation channel family protein [Flocculibacter collagenilyticus]
MGLAFFMAMGTQKALSFGLTHFIAVRMGTITGVVFGGAIRDEQAPRSTASATLRRNPLGLVASGA